MNPSPPPRILKGVCGRVPPETLHGPLECTGVHSFFDYGQCVIPDDIGHLHGVPRCIPSDVFHLPVREIDVNDHKRSIRVVV